MASPTLAVGAYAPNYAWVGAPAGYNGTGGTGGDSGEDLTLSMHKILFPTLTSNFMKLHKRLTVQINSRRKSESMV